MAVRVFPGNSPFGLSCLSWLPWRWFTALAPSLVSAAMAPSFLARVTVPHFAFLVGLAKVLAIDFFSKNDNFDFVGFLYFPIPNFLNACSHFY